MFGRMPVCAGNYPATGEQAAGLILIILKYIEIKSSSGLSPCEGWEAYEKQAPEKDVL